jgi:hypothetical protein
MCASLNGLLGHMGRVMNNIRIGEERNETKVCGIKRVKINKKRKKKTERYLVM